MGKVLFGRCAIGLRHFLTAIRRWRDYGGCSSRNEFWSFVGVSAALYGLLTLVYRYWYPNDDAVATILSLMVLPIGLPFLALASRRFHDVGLSAWFVVFGFFTAHLSTLVVALVPSRDSRKCWSEPEITKRPRLSQRMRRAPIVQSIVWWCITSVAFLGTAIPFGAFAESCSKAASDPVCSFLISAVVFVLLCGLTPLFQWFVFLCFCTSEASVRAFRIVFALNFLPWAWLLLAVMIYIVPSLF